MLFRVFRFMCIKYKDKIELEGGVFFGVLVILRNFKSIEIYGERYNFFYVCYWV